MAKLSWMPESDRDPTVSLKPYNVDPEKIIKNTDDLIAALVLRCREKKISLSSSRKIPGTGWLNLNDWWKGKFTDSGTRKVLAMADGLDLEVVLRPKRRRPDRSRSTDVSFEDEDETHTMSQAEWDQIKFIWEQQKKGVALPDEQPQG